MGERMSGDGARDRRRTHPGGAVSGARDVRDTAALETALAAAIRGGGQLDPEAEQRAVAAFRAARDAGAHRARTRLRDDWRQSAQRRAGRSLKTTFGVVFASLTLGGVAVAAIGSAGSSTHGAGDGRGTADPTAAHPSAVAPDRPGGQNSSASAGTGPTDGPASAQDTEAHCRAYENVGDRGKALDATAWKRLVTAAGGKDKVAAYCSGQLARTTPAPETPGSAGSAAGAGDSAGTGGAGSTGGTGVGSRATASAAASGNAASGSGPGGTDGGTDNAAGNGRTSGGESGGSGGNHR